MNILFIHEVDWLDKVVFDIHSLSESLSLLGHQVYAIDYEKTWSRNGPFDLGSLKTREFNGVSRAFSGASVCLRRPGFIKIPGLSRMSAFFTHGAEVGRTIRERNIEAVILYSVPTNGLSTICSARRSRIPVLFRSIDMVNRLVPYPALRPVVRRLEKKVYSGADMVLPNTPQYYKYVIASGVPESRVRLLPFPVDTGLFRPGVDSTEVRQKWGLGTGEPAIVFIGTLFDFCGLDTFLREFPAVLKEVPGVKLLIVGDGPLRPVLERIIAELGLQQQVVITGFQPYRTMPQYIDLATVCINTFLISDNTMDMFPAKMMQYVACGKATVATALRGITTILPGESHGVVYVNNAAEMAGAVIPLLKSPERRKALESAGLSYIKENHSYDKIAERLEAILEEAIKEKRNATGK